MGIRLLTIPVEDAVYGMLLILMNINLFEWLLKQNGNRWPRYTSTSEA